MRVLLLGANGQLGTDLVKTNPGHEIIPATRADADVTNAGLIDVLVMRYAPQVVINTTAFNRTEDCEDLPEVAMGVNALGPRNVARACAHVNARLVHFSTDFVFDGKKGAPYVESDAPRPLSVYGLSKLGGEYMTLAVSEGNIVIRSSSLFGAAGSSGKGGNFLESVIKRALSGKAVHVIHSIVMTPTYTLDLAQRTWEILARNPSGGVYHAANSGACSWYDFAREAFRLLGLPEPSPVASFPSKMKRAPYSALASERLGELGLSPLRSWTDALKAYLVEKGHLAPV